MCLVVDHRRVSSTLCALGSVARLSVSMTMSISSGLYSLSNADVGKPDSSSSHVDFSRSLTDFQRYDSVPEAADDEGEDDIVDSDDGVLYMGSLPLTTSALIPDCDDKATVTVSSQPSSPVNTSGVRIVVNEGGDSHASSREDLVVRGSVDSGAGYLALVDNGRALDVPSPTSATGLVQIDMDTDMDSTRNRYCSSQQHLLKDMS